MAGWTDEEDVVLLDGVRRGVSYGQISEQLSGRSRGACIGRAQRKGFVSSCPEALAKAQKRAAQKAFYKKHKHKKTGAAGQGKGSEKSCVANITTVDRRNIRHRHSALPDGKGAALVESVNPVCFIERKEEQCSWPLGDPRDDDFLYCGNVCGRHEPFCEGHAKVAIRSKPGAKKRRSALSNDPAAPTIQRAAASRALMG